MDSDKPAYVEYKYRWVIVGLYAMTTIVGSIITGTVAPTATNADEFFANVITNWTPARDQSDYATGYSASDLMVGMGTPGTTVGSNGKCPLDITFAHKMGLVTLSSPSDVTAVEFKNFKPYKVDGVYHYLLKPATQTLLEGIFTRNGQAQPYNFDAVVGEVCDFLGLEWTDAMRNFAERGDKFREIVMGFKDDEVE